MSLLAIEINDCGLIAVRDSKVVLDSPGFALLENGKPTVGRSAAKKAYLLPSQVSTRFWDELSTTPLPRTLDPGMTHADLVYAHLATIWEAERNRCDGVILAVPAFYSRAQLELLLGITRAIQMPVVGLVDIGVAGAWQQTVGWRTALHLDIYLHRVALSRLAVHPEIARTATHASPAVGMIALDKTWVSAIARRFVRETRFDPQHGGQTEQTLHDELPRLLRNLHAQSTAMATLAFGARTFSVTLSRDELARAASDMYRHILALVTPHLAEPGPVGVLLSAHLTGLPGLSERLSALGDFEIRALAPGAGARGALEQQQRLLQTPGSLSLVTRLPAASGAALSQAPAPPPPPSAATPSPTHLLYRGVAHPLGEVPFTLGRELAPGLAGLRILSDAAGISRDHCTLLNHDGRLLLEDHSRYGTYVNGEKVKGSRALSVGDRIRLGTLAEELQVIALTGYS